MDGKGNGCGLQTTVKVFLWGMTEQNDNISGNAVRLVTAVRIYSFNVSHKLIIKNKFMKTHTHTSVMANTSTGRFKKVIYNLKSHKLIHSE
jgi:hypothetical protein